MNDTLEKTSVDIKAQEHERMSQVLSAENVKGKEATAQALLAKTDLSASDILAILETVQVAKQTNALDVAMAQIKNPAITPSAEKNTYTPEQDGTSAPGETTAKDAASKKSTAPSTDADTSKQP